VVHGRNKKPPPEPQMWQWVFVCVVVWITFFYLAIYLLGVLRLIGIIAALVIWSAYKTKRAARRISE
jgi:hypothetical protein